MVKYSTGEKISQSQVAVYLSTWLTGVGQTNTHSVWFCALGSATSTMEYRELEIEISAPNGRFY